MRYLWQGEKTCSLQSLREYFIKGLKKSHEEVKMIVDSHRRGPRKSHSKLKEYAKDIGIKRKLSQEEFDKEIVQIKEKLSELINLLQEGEEDQRQGCILRKKKVKWSIMQEKMD